MNELVPVPRAVRSAEPLSLASLSPYDAIRAPRRIATAVIIAFFGVGGAAATLAPLQSAVIAQGEISTAQLRSTIQPLEGGTLAAVRVREGQSVRRGQLLATLEDVRSGAQYEAAIRMVRQFAAELARLEAERDGATTLSFSHPSLRDQGNPQVAALLDRQFQLLLAGRQTIANRRDVLRQQSAQYRQQINAARQQIAITDRQLSLMSEQVAAIDSLYKRGLATKPRLLDLQGQQADLAARRAQLDGSIAQSLEAISGVELQIIELENERRDENGRVQADLQTRLAEAERNLITARDQVRKTELRAPADGIVFALQHSVPGAVIGAGEKLMEIVPREAQLTVRVRVSPLDIDSVRRGQRARVVLSGLPREAHHSFYGEVFEVGGDLEKTKDGRVFYQLLVRLDRGEVVKRLGEVSLVSGMPVEVFLEGPSRTLLSYVTDPISSVMEAGLRER